MLVCQISGDASVVKKALHQIASRLHDNPSRSQHLLSSANHNVYPSNSSVMGASAGPPIMGLAPLMGHYGGYKGESADWSRSMYSAPRTETAPKEFSLRLVCPTANIGGVIGKGGMIINQIRQDSGAGIKVDSGASEGDERVISITAKEVKKKLLLDRVLLDDLLFSSNTKKFPVSFIRSLKIPSLQQLMQLCDYSPGAVRKLKETLVLFHLQHDYLFLLLELDVLLGKEGPLYQR